MLRKIIITIIIITGTSSLWGQKQIRAFRLSGQPVIDGIFEPAIWAGADSTTGFIQMEPSPGSPASSKTVVWVGYDNESFYSVIKSYQATPPVARNQNRDALSKNDDLVAIILDTYQDNRTGYGFFCSPIGTQIDIKINDDGRNLDTNWDTEWECEAGVFEGGWVAEFRIPFKSIKYKKDSDMWGFNAGRVIRSNFETVYWSGQLSDDFRISQGGKMSGIGVPGSTMSLSLFPYISGIKTSGEKLNADAGVDAEWQISPNASLNATYNPDFATVEADEIKINLTRYELRYPEKRLFFQEGNEMYNTRIKQFYSRRIQDIDWGARFNGKIGNYQVNALSAMSPKTDAGDPLTFFNVGRVKKDILKSSTVGLMVVDKSWNGGGTRSVGLDYVLNLGKTWKMTGQFVGSAPGNFLKSSAWFMRFARENNIYHYHIRLTDIGENFRENVNETGFITDDDRRELDFSASYRFWMKTGPVKYIDIGTNDNIFWSHAGTLRSWDLDHWVGFYLNSKLSFKYNYNNEFKLYEKEFYNYKNEFSVGYNTEEWSHLQVGLTRGRNFDSDLVLASAGGRVKLFQNFSLSYTAQYLDLDPDPNGLSTFNNILTANYNFTKDLWLKVFAQSGRIDERVYFYGLFGWRFKPPFGALYLIWSHDQFDDMDILYKTNSVFLKLTLPLTIIK